MTRAGIVPLVAAVALVSAEAANAALTPSQYHAQANAICTSAQAKEKALGGSKPMTNAQLAKLVIDAGAIMSWRYSALRALQPPASLVAAHRKALWSTYDILTPWTSLVTAVKAGTDPKTAAAATLGKNYVNLVIRAAVAWNATGATACGTRSFDVSFGSGK
jgi:hypothetical protein